jgi:hypothetical protein
MSNKVYLEVDWGAGKLYQWLKTEEEDSVKHVSSTGKVSYRRYFNNVVGKLNNFSIGKNSFKRDELRWSMYNENDNTTYYLSTPLENQEKYLTKVVVSVIRQMHSLDKGKVYRCLYYKIEKEDSRNIVGFSFAAPEGDCDPYADNAKFTTVHKLPIEDQPKWEKVKKGRNEVWDRSEYEVYYDNIMNKEVERLKYDESDSNQSSKASEQEAVTAEAVEEEYNDLPF